ncbi:MAG TPA: 4-hydroxythreonine-4-phosphate dehydrogenase PdxA [Ramlibacter sp.]|uniref:PdxA family dehydrogenase n=1 Tax=Ramlibacter sp. TaxID=1917967 RepID=UPI002C2537E2|nr:4-hydroxythreonine-4-phosphate dehydrogenase PdxA [Ramlibacter sp.]HVZ46547.1 4-hydroxythreonine-4-phosphate dehydrogenase PdxA [Ramlibacter sp.]
MTPAGPILATVIGDPCGIGPEVLVKALAESPPRARVLAIGSAQAVKAAASSMRGGGPRVRAIARARDASYAPGILEVLDPGTLDAKHIRPGVVSADCGRAVVEWRALAAEIVHRGEADAIVQAPIHSGAIQAALGTGPIPSLAGGAPTHLMLVAGRLRIVHLTDHITLREMLDHVRAVELLALLRLVHDKLAQWGLRSPVIAVAGLNPHCQGPEERDEIAPAIRSAVESGIDARGPIAPDAVFRLAARGDYDCVVAHYHDQGHIAVKTANFGEGCAIVLGEPHLRVSVAHGTGFDIAGRGVASAQGMTVALHTATSLAAGRGFSGPG